ncbi:MAG: class I SAM-dependent methyltransferase [Casimicrobiaceae bacterium]
MSDESTRELDAAALDLFARKGYEGGPSIPQAGPANAVKVRRVMQLTRDLCARPFAELRILDLGCGEGVYAIEAALGGADVLALDARRERMDEGARVAARHGLRNLRFVQQDVRDATRETLGTFDVVYLLGLLYHLDAPEVFALLANVQDICTQVLVIDTLISLAAEAEVEWRGEVYQGRRHREHEDDDDAGVRRSRLLRSIDNTFAFRFTRGSLLRAVHAAGFMSVLECHVPFEPGKGDDRITVVALKGAPVRLAAYPWVNGLTEREIARALLPDEGMSPRPVARCGDV